MFTNCDLKNKFLVGGCFFIYETRDMMKFRSSSLSSPSLTFQNLTVNLRTTMFNVKFYMVFTLRLCVLYASQNKQQHFPYTALTD